MSFQLGTNLNIRLQSECVKASTSLMHSDTLALFDHRSVGTPIKMSQEQPNNPLHGLTLEMILVRLQEHYGWEGLDAKIQINCFYSNPSIKSSLKFYVVLNGHETKCEAAVCWNFLSVI